jgi:Bacterial alpha-L-rhamnosidase C-terminal domain
MRPVVRAEIIGGDALGRGQEPALCWWLPDGASVQHAYRLRTDDGFETGRVDSETQSFVRVPVFDRSRRSAAAQVKVWTDLGESEWSDPVPGLRRHAADAAGPARARGAAGRGERGSLNHYSKGAVATFLHRYVAGLRPVEPGYRAFEVRPRPGGGIRWASARHDGPFGQIDVTWRVDGGSMELDVLVPGGSRATVVMPGADPHDAGPGRHHWTGPAPTG